MEGTEVRKGRRNKAELGHKQKKQERQLRIKGTVNKRKEKENKKLEENVGMITLETERGKSMAKKENVR